MASKPRTACRGLCITGVIAFLAACAASPVFTDYDSGADFARYRTFGFVDKAGLEGEQYRSLLAGRLETAISRQLTALGYQPAAAGAKPDLTVDYHAHVEEKQRIVTYLEPVHWWRPWYTPWPAYQPQVQTVEYTEGTLTINLVDTARKQMVWQGIRRDTVTRRDLEYPGQAVNAAVIDIFERFPHPARR